MEAALEVLGGGALQDIFSAIITSDVDTPKPHPQTYEKAVSIMWVSSHLHAGQLKIRQMGFDRQVQSGLRVIGVRGTNEESLLLAAGAERVVDDLRELSLITLKSGSESNSKLYIFKKFLTI